MASSSWQKGRRCRWELGGPSSPTSGPSPGGHHPVSRGQSCPEATCPLPQPGRCAVRPADVSARGTWDSLSYARQEALGSQRRSNAESRKRPRVTLPCVGRGGFPFIRTSPCPGLLQTRGRRTPVLGPRARPSLSRRRQPAVPALHLLAPAAHRTGPGGSRGSGGIYSRFPVSWSCG